MPDNYKVLHDGVGQFAKGDVIPQSYMDDNKINVGRLLKLEAIVPVGESEAEELMTVQSENGLQALGTGGTGEAPPPGMTTGKPIGLAQEGGAQQSSQTTKVVDIVPPELPLDDAALAAKLKDAGFDTQEKLLGATDDEIRAIPGIGPVALAKIHALIHS